MRGLIIVFLCGLCAGATGAIAQGREAIGTGRLFSNDYLGDGRDRWRTGSYVYSHVRGYRDGDAWGRAFGDVIEYRFRGEIITQQGGQQRAGARPFVGALSVGAHTHFDLGVLDASLGFDLTAVGPQTGLDDLQEDFHQRFRMPVPFQGNALKNAFYTSGTVAVGHTFQLGQDATFRPFIEAQTGVEDILRIGGDVLVGPVGQDDLMLRDVVTGQLYRASQSPGFGASLLLGADVAAVGDTVFLPQDQAFDRRTRGRVGMHVQFSEQVTLFYGMTYLSEEFKGQPESQVLGSVKLSFNF